MTPSRIRGVATLFAAIVTTAAAPNPAASQAITPPSPGMPGEAAAIAKARADSARYPYVQADIDFMTGMIGHHSQAIVMADMAPTHGASPSLLTLAERIKNAQQDEIRTMQQWLADRQLPIPDGHSPMHMAMTDSSMHSGMHSSMHSSMHPDSGMMEMHGMSDHTLMPGMLTPAQMKQLDAARGPEFDRLFLTYMIQHHSGALTMVQKLFGSYGAAQDELVFKFASDVNVDQTTEIARMRRMLVAVMFPKGSQ